MPCHGMVKFRSRKPNQLLRIERAKPKAFRGGLPEPWNDGCQVPKQFDPLEEPGRPRQPVTLEITGSNPVWVANFRDVAQLA